MTTKAELDLVFGPGTGEEAHARALQSKIVFVKSIDQIAEDNVAATGRRLSALEALRQYGFDILLQVAYEGSAPNPKLNSIGALIRDRRDTLGLDHKILAKVAKEKIEVVEAIEANKRVPLKSYEKVARVLGLNESKLGIESSSLDNEGIAVRLRRIGEESNLLSPGSVARLSEAAWVAARQVELCDLLGEKRKKIPFLPEVIKYGRPAYKDGYELANKARRDFQITDFVKSLRELVEERLGIPFIQAELEDGVAGATLLVNDVRAIVVNVSGENKDALMRRMTIAHELGHLLFDPDQNLDNLVVDGYDSFNSLLLDGDEYEQRANAFAAEFLAPRDLVVSKYRQSEDEVLSDTMNYFGISYTVTRNQLANSGERIVVSNRTAARGNFQEWEAREDFTLAYHPIRGIRPTRAGKFSAIVAKAFMGGQISLDTACEYLECDSEMFEESLDAIKGLFPEVFDK